MTLAEVAEGRYEVFLADDVGIDVQLSNGWSGSYVGDLPLAAVEMLDQAFDGLSAVFLKLDDRVVCFLRCQFSGVHM